VGEVGASERASECACVRALFDVRLQVCALTRDTLETASWRLCFSLNPKAYTLTANPLDYTRVLASARSLRCRFKARDGILTTMLLRKPLQPVARQAGRKANRQIETCQAGDEKERTDMHAFCAHACGMTPHHGGLEDGGDEQRRQDRHESACTVLHRRYREHICDDGEDEQKPCVDRQRVTRGERHASISLHAPASAYRRLAPARLPAGVCAGTKSGQAASSLRRARSAPARSPPVSSSPVRLT